MLSIALKEKLSNETIKAVFDFSSQLAIGESVSSASTVATVYSGTDSSPSSLVSGSAAVSSPQVTQALAGGVAGVVYEVRCTAITSASQTLVQRGYQAVL